MPRETVRLSTHEPTDDPVPRIVVLELFVAFRVLEALAYARPELSERGAASGLGTNSRRVIRLLYGQWGLDEGGAP